jgi:hypothetical protein
VISRWIRSCSCFCAARSSSVAVEASTKTLRPLRSATVKGMAA